MELVGTPPWQMWVVFAAILVTVVFYSVDRLPLEITSVGSLSFLLVFFQIFPISGEDTANMLDARALLAGFAEPALVSVLALLVLGQGLFQTGALERPAQILADIGGNYPSTTLAATFIFIAAISAFLNNTPVTVMFIPIVATLAARMNLTASEVMMQVSFVSILGGMTTLIGSSTNLLAAGFMKQAGEPPIGMFDFTVPGLVLAVVGLAYSIVVMPRLLPRRADLTEELHGGEGEGRQYIAQIQINADHPMVGATSRAGMFPQLPELTVRMIQRGEHVLLPPFDDVELEAGDVLVVAATRPALADILTKQPKMLRGMLRESAREAGDDQRENLPRGGGDLVLAEAVVAPASRMSGRTLEQIGFRASTRCLLLGIQRRSRMIRTSLNNIRFEAGDVLLVLGRARDIDALRNNRDVLLLEWSAASLPDNGLALRAIAVFAATVGLVLTGLLPIAVAAVLGATATLFTGVLNVRQAARAIDRRIFLLVGSAIALATALQATGGAHYIAEQLVHATHDLSLAVLLSAFFIVVALMTNIMTNNASAVLFAPIALSTAAALGVDGRVFLFTVILAANCSFATPMGYQTNLLVMSPGNYRFRDFLRAGIPLVILLWITYSIFAPWYYGL